MTTRVGITSWAVIVFVSVCSVACWAQSPGTASDIAGDEAVDAVAGKERELTEKEPDRKARLAIDSLAILVAYDNYPHVDGLIPEWGFSCVVRGADKTILFDTGGDGSILMANMRKLDMNPKDVDIVFLSHAHWDHIGGLETFLGKNPDVTVYLLPSFERGFKRQVAALGADIIEVKEPVEICPCVYSTGQLGTGIKEQSMILETDKGLIVITGCAHPGIVHIIRKSEEILKDEVLLAMGGFHLVRTSAADLGSVIKGFREAGVKYAGPCHCSGDEARARFNKEYKQHYVDIGVGRLIIADDLR
jgi:7,8-dihydropterin-6-yl-methyl-4-(beta-D-ribofuranosyl)aminobenzene 5'-phosphate synthase